MSALTDAVWPDAGKNGDMAPSSSVAKPTNLQNFKHECIDKAFLLRDVMRYVNSQMEDYRILPGQRLKHKMY